MENKDSTVFKCENVEDGVWLHAKNPSTQETNRIKVTFGPDGIILDVWVDSFSDGPIQSISDRDWETTLHLQRFHI